MKGKSKIKAGLLIGVALLLITSVLLGACANEVAPAAPVAPTAPVAPVAPAPVKVIKLSYGTTGTPNPLQPGYGESTTKWWASELNKRTNGRVEIELFWGGVLGQTGELTDLASKGALDIVHTVPSFLGEFAMWEVPGNSFFPIFPSTDFAIRVPWQMHKEFPVFDEAWANLNLKWIWAEGSEPYGIHSNVPMGNLAEVKGKKLLSWGTWLPKVLDLVGIIPVAIPYTDHYDALDKKVVAGKITGLPEAMIGYKYYEVTRYIYDLSLGHLTTNPRVINLKVYNSLPDDIKKIFDEVNYETVDYFLTVREKLKPQIWDFMAGFGAKVYPFDKADKQKWLGMIGDLNWAEWLKQMDKRGQGILAQQVKNRYLEITGDPLKWANWEIIGPTASK